MADQRLIDANAFKENMFKYAAPEMVWDMADIIHKIDEMPSAQLEPQWIPIFKAKDENSDQWVTGFYFAYPETTYCFTEDYERHPVKIIHCITFHRMTDWCLPNIPTVCNIDIDTLELVGWVDSKRKTFGDEPWILPEPWRGEEHETD